MINIHYKKDAYNSNCAPLDSRRKRIRKTILAHSEPDLQTIRLGGCMALPEFELLIPSNDTCMDVLGLGKETNKLDARWHFVLDEDKAEKLLTEGARPQMNMPMTWRMHTKRVKVDLPHTISTRKTKNKTPVSCNKDSIAH